MPLRPSQKPQRDVFAPPQSHPMYRRIAFSFLGLTVIIVIGALWISSVRARITVKMKREVTSVDTFVDIAKNPDAGQLRGRVVEGVFESPVHEFPVKSTTVSVPTVGVVQGTVRITNNYSKPQTLVQTTRLLTSDNRLYRIDKTVTIEPKQSVLVAAHSDKPGAQYIMTAGTKMTIPGLWIDIQKWIYAESVSGFTGGEQSSSRVVAQSDLNDAYTSLEAEAYDLAKKTLKAEAGVTDDYDVIYDEKVTDKKSNISLDQKADSFLASVKIDVTAVYYPSKEMASLIHQKLTDKMPDERELIDFDPSRTTSKLDQTDPKLEKARVHILADSLSRLTEKSPQLALTNFLGLSSDDAKAKLSAIEGVESVEIRIQPSWINKIPSNASHVELIVQ